MVKKGLEYYLKLPYTTTLKRGTGDGPEYWVARVLELPHCMTHGDTPEEALRDIEDAKKEWIKSRLASGLPVPEPAKFTGQYHLRMPPSLHEALTIKSESEAVSLNQFMVTALARAVGYAESSPRKSGKGTKALQVAEMSAGYETVDNKRKKPAKIVSKAEAKAPSKSSLVKSKPRGK